MAETTGFSRFTGSLDPAAQEFIPRNPNQAALFGVPPPAPPPPPPQALLPPPTHQLYFPYPPISDAVPYAHYPAPSAYVSAAAAVCAPVPPQSATATRAVLLSCVPGDVTEGVVRREAEGFGVVRCVEMERAACEGIATVHFYDLRHAERALREFREQYMQQQDRLRRGHYDAMSFVPNNNNMSVSMSSPLLVPGGGLVAGRAVWADFVIPALRAAPDGHNQGTIVIFNLDSSVTTSTLIDIFRAFGPVKEFRETPSKKHQKFIEFFDVRDAAKALKEMNGNEINGKQVVIEFSRPGGHSRKYLNAINTTATPAFVVSPNIINVAPVLSTNTCLSFQTSSKYSPPESGGEFSSRHNSFGAVPPRLHNPASAEIQFSSSKANWNNGGCMSSNSKGVESKMVALSLDGMEDRRDSLLPPKRSSLLKKRCQNSQNQGLVSPKPQQPKSSRGKKGRRQAKKLDSRFLIKEDAMVESTSGETRTTVMIKNIPNKYSQKLLLNMLDNHCIHCNEQIIADGGANDDDEEGQPLSSYDFVYLPIDFNNKCNVGYGFVNMTSPEATWRLYKAFNHQHWEVFNSRKICEVTYARVQGLEALKEHFKNSKFPCEMEHYLPVVFSPPRDGRLHLTEPLPVVAPPPAQSNNINNNINTSNHHSSNSCCSSSSIPISLLLSPPPHHPDQHDPDMDAPVSASDSDEDDDDNDCSRNGCVLMADEDDE